MTKIAFISDIHGNFDALLAVMTALKEEACDLTLCLGDIVGYGPSPCECVDFIRQNNIQAVLGNHDEYVTLLMDTRVERLREDIRIAVEWTQSQLPMDALKWLSRLPFEMAAEDVFTFIHGSFAPGKWGYCLDEGTFAANFKNQEAQLAFCGHSHSPLIGIDRPGGTPVVDYIRHCKLPENEKIMINVGSVGQPRDRDPRACAVTYVVETRELKLHRVEYDIAVVQEKIKAAGLPEKFAQRLEVGR